MKLPVIMCSSDPDVETLSQTLDLLQIKIALKTMKESVCLKLLSGSLRTESLTSPLCPSQTLFIFDSRFG